jgi:hypothetical protein
MSDITGLFVIGDDTPSRTYDATALGKGLIPRNYNEFPVGCYGSAPPFSVDEMPLVDWDDIPDRIAELERTKTRLSDIYQHPSLDQNGQGYCWFYSGTGCIQVLRERNNQPYQRLSAHSGAWVIKNGRDQGGWGAQGLDFQRERGVMPIALWPEKSMDGRRHNTAENWEAAKEYRVTEGFVDLDPPQYDRDLSVHQVISCLLNRVPVIGDYNWWGHSVAMLDVLDLYPSRSKRDPRRYGTNILNSWTDRWGTRGRGVLKDSKAFPDGASAPRAVWGN